jgi:hypothetical protein
MVISDSDGHSQMIQIINYRDAIPKTKSIYSSVLLCMGAPSTSNRGER